MLEKSALETLCSSQFAFSTQVIKSNYLVFFFQCLYPFRSDNLAFHLRSAFFLSTQPIKILQNLPLMLQYSSFRKLPLYFLKNTSFLICNKQYNIHQITISFWLKSVAFFQRNFAWSPLNCLRFGVHLIAKYFHATKFKNVLFSNLNLV